jgi:hypothetical protein
MILKDVSHAQYLERKVNPKKLNLLDGFIWGCFKGRSYHRNKNKREYFEMLLFSYILSALAVAAFVYLPFKYIMALLFLGVNANTLVFSIGNANQSRYVIWLNLLVGSIGLLSHVEFGLTVFGYHFEHYFFMAFIISGLLSVYRRFWNHIIWWKLDSIVVKHRWG